MTIYATLSDIIERAGEDEILQVADRDRDGVADPDVIAAAIATAGSEIDGYISVRYRLPLPAVPNLIKTWAVSIARYHLHINGAPDHVVRDWKAAMDGLRDVARSVINLPVDEAGSQPVDGAGRVILVRPTKDFGGFL
ncbi:DUF1320 domain-containing protein [Agrobacterium vitis]|uniref:DUF1320 domain-containing protein n=1 Tax=Agrobacterium vitis TaxID=373 RepID=A0AAE2RD56_AGRVI|nr:DUF1320 domain-containing protein [Agrobacterium vitis]MBF2715497.1 DUF1320 domain-containing protein [Agrobacterium vitis]